MRKGSNITFNIANIGKIWENQGKIWKIWSMTKKWSSEIFATKMEIFSPKNLIQKSWVRRKNFPLNLAPGLRHWKEHGHQQAVCLCFKEEVFKMPLWIPVTIFEKYFTYERYMVATGRRLVTELALSTGSRPSVTFTTRREPPSIGPWASSSLAVACGA